MYRRVLNKLNNNIDKLILSNEKPFYKKGDFYISLILAIASIFLAVLAMMQTKELSNQQQQIKGFDVLLNNSKNQTDTLNKAIAILSNQLAVLASQLKLNEEQQKLLNIQAGYTSDANETKFRLAEYNLRLLVFSAATTRFQKLIDWDSISRKEYLNNAEKIIKNELDNPFLLKSPNLAKLWNGVYGKISNYYFVSKFDAAYKEPQQLKKDLNMTWVNCFSDIGKSWQITYGYLMDMTYNKSKNPQFKTWYYNRTDSSYQK